MGAGVGSDSPATTSHAGAIVAEGDFALAVYDENPAMAEQAAKDFGVLAIGNLRQDDLAAFDVAVICTPTDTHVPYLRKLLAAGARVIVCEKPVCNDLRSLRTAEQTYDRGESLVLVNYFRRFLPAYAALQSTIARLASGQGVRAIAVRYQRGFLNNASHALDLLQFLLGWDILAAKASVTSCSADEFPNDPTLSLCGVWNDAELTVTGLPRVKFSLFEIDIFMEQSAVRIYDRGDVVEIETAKKGGGYYSPLRTISRRSDCLGACLHHLYVRVRKVLQGKTAEDNFAASLRLAQWMLHTRKRGAKACHD
jgi:predicted dehydrogenase